MEIYTSQTTVPEITHWDKRRFRVIYDNSNSYFVLQDHFTYMAYKIIINTELSYVEATNMLISGEIYSVSIINNKVNLYVLPEEMIPRITNTHEFYNPEKYNKKVIVLPCEYIMPPPSNYNIHRIHDVFTLKSIIMREFIPVKI